VRPLIDPKSDLVRSVVYRGRDETTAGRGSQTSAATVLEDNDVKAAITPPEPAPAPALLDVRAVAVLLDCSPRHVYRLADAGHMPPPVRLGALVRWRRQDIETWLAGGCKPCQPARRG
jgi:excisionase family DNA binding protein